MFKNAKPVWAKDYKNEKNIMLEFTAHMDFIGENAKIKLTPHVVTQNMTIDATISAYVKVSD